MLKQTSDYHVHSHFSLCATPEATLDNYIEIARKEGITTIGIADHMWDETVPGASGWYQAQSIERGKELRNELSDQKEIKICFGCETEMEMHDKIGMSEEGASQLDFIIVPIGHFHMVGFTTPEHITDYAYMRKRLIERFLKVAATPYVDGYAHPFVVLGCDDMQEMLSGFTDKEYEECFRAAAETKKSVEIHSDYIHHALVKDEDGFNAEYRRYMTIAAECGCNFHFGTDAHHPNEFHDFDKLSLFAEACGIRPEQIIPLEELHKTNVKNS